MYLNYLRSQKNTVKTLFGGVITNNVVSLVSAGVDFERRNIKLKEKQSPSPKSVTVLRTTKHN